MNEPVQNDKPQTSETQAIGPAAQHHEVNTVGLPPNVQSTAPEKQGAVISDELKGLVNHAGPEAPVETTGKVELPTKSSQNFKPTEDTGWAREIINRRRAIAHNEKVAEYNDAIGNIPDDPSDARATEGK